MWLIEFQIVLPRIYSLLTLVLSISTGCFVDAVGEAPGSGGTSSDGGQGPQGGEGAGFSTGGMVNEGAGANVGGEGPNVCDDARSCTPSLAGGDVVVIAIGDHACPTGFGSKVLGGDGSDPGCSNCSCTMTASDGAGTCTPGLETGYNDSACTNERGNIQLDDMQCYQLPGAGSIDAHRMDPPTASGGTCGVSSPTMPAAVSLTTVCTVDASFSGPCLDGGRCVPDTAAPFDRVCNLLPVGEATCGAGWSELASFRELLQDTRDCSCNCTETAGPTCANAELRLYNGNSCAGGAVATFAADGNCNDSSSFGQHNSERAIAGTWTEGTCESETAQSGELSWGPARKLCCLQ